MKDSEKDPIQLEPRRAARIVLRALRRRCPNCGGGPLFSRWIVMRGSCPKCRLRLDRGEDDYFIGGYIVNFVAAELLIVAGALVGVVLTWPDVPWTTLKYALFLLVAPTPLFFYPWAKTLWLGIDLVFRPVTLADIEGHGEMMPDDPAVAPPFSHAP
ncbi:MAG: DUF983 domain-containing protein [Gemmatimonadota bacterium]